MNVHTPLWIWGLPLLAASPWIWSPAQMRARQSDRMATVQAFLNSQWKHESEGVRWFDPHRDSLYADRIRRH